MSHSETSDAWIRAEFSQVSDAFALVASGCPRQESNLRPFA
jgi:hypothetical protein